MKTKLGASLIAALMMMGLFGVVGATADPGPNGNNNNGLCTAYFNGQKKGHDKNGQPGPFQALEDEAEEQAPRNNDEDDDNNVSGFEAVFDYCNSLYSIGGNPEHGRYDCTPDDPETDEDEFGCTERDDPNTGRGKSG
jgi:hypothetical protein